MFLAIFLTMIPIYYVQTIYLIPEQRRLYFFNLYTDKTHTRELVLRIRKMAFYFIIFLELKIWVEPNIEMFPAIIKEIYMDIDRRIR